MILACSTDSIKCAFLMVASISSCYIPFSHLPNSMTNRHIKFPKIAARQRCLYFCSCFIGPLCLLGRFFCSPTLFLEFRMTEKVSRKSNAILSHFLVITKTNREVEFLREVFQTFVFLHPCSSRMIPRAAAIPPVGKIVRGDEEFSQERKEAMIGTNTRYRLFE